MELATMILVIVILISTITMIFVIYQEYQFCKYKKGLDYLRFRLRMVSLKISRLRKEIEK